MSGDLARKILLRCLAPFSLLLAWEVLVSTGILDRTLLPPPSRIASAIFQFARSGLLLGDAVASFSRIGRGVVVGVGLGLLIGFLTGRTTIGYFLLDPILQIFRPIPAFSLIPLAIVLFGVGNTGKLFIVAWASFFPCWLSTHTSVSQVPRELVWTAQLLGASQTRILTTVIFRSALPYIAAGIRLSIGLAFAATVVVEMAGAESGLGYRITASHLAFTYDSMFAAIFLVGLAGAVLDLGFRTLIDRISYR